MQLNSCFFEPWLEYRHPAVRQLAFAIASPNIVAALPAELELKHHFSLQHPLLWQQHYNNYRARLLQLDANPQALLDFLSQLKSTRLGLRFEMLLWFWLLDDAYHPYQLLGHSIQKIDGAKTLGELDFVLYNKDTQQIEHWEVALKYYLAEADGSLQHWYGLNRSDTLQRKLTHFSQKQFQFQHACEHTIQQRFAIIKGQLYTPQHTSITLPNWINLARRIGSWGDHIQPEPHDYYRLQRHEWICPEINLSSAVAQWWTDGLYYSASGAAYMYRTKPLICFNPRTKS